MRVIFHYFDVFYGAILLPFKKLSNDRSYKFSWILTQTEVISIWKLRMRVISAILNFFMVLSYCPLKNCPMIVLISLAKFYLKQKLSI